MSTGAVPPPSASEPTVRELTVRELTVREPGAELTAELPTALIGRLPDAAVARFRGEVERLAARAFNSAMLDADEPLALAISGGPDSMAMLALAACAFPGRVRAATFDHGLREGAAAEAAMVADACQGLVVPHVVLTGERAIAGSSLQARAREARYAALTAWTATRGVAVLLTAHHADDQAETLLMRLNRASGLAGLAGVRPWRFENGTAVLRPLLGERRAALREIVVAAGLPFVDDPSNADPRHDRSRVRAAMAALPELDPARLAASAAYLAEAEEVIGAHADAIWAERWHGTARALAVAGEPRELRRRLLRRAIGATREALGILLPPFGESSNVEAALDALEAGRGVVQGGVKIDADAAGWRFRAAPARRR